MPRKPLRPCGYNGCPNLSDSFYCERHRRERVKQYNKYQRDPSINERYGAEWRKIRARYIKAHPLCEECMARGRYTPATEVHHIKPLSEGGTHDEQNLAAMCHACHSRITMAANNNKKLDLF